MKNKQNIFLIGPMGAGKTTVGRNIARRLKIDFFDSDREIENLCGVNIPTIFEYEGEQGFRDRETKVIDELSQRTSILLATGGGSILRPENRKMLSQRGTVIYMHVNLKEQFSRVSNDKNRPLLQTENPRETLRKMMLERTPIYESIADYRVNSNGNNMRHVIDQILRHLGRKESKTKERRSDGNN